MTVDREAIAKIVGPLRELNSETQIAFISSLVAGALAGACEKGMLAQYLGEALAADGVAIAFVVNGELHTSCISREIVGNPEGTEVVRKFFSTVSQAIMEIEDAQGWIEPEPEAVH